MQLHKRTSAPPGGKEQQCTRVWSVYLIISLFELCHHCCEPTQSDVRGSLMLSSWPPGWLKLK